MSRKNVKNKILLVDDDEKLCRLIKNYLEPMGYQVQTVYTGREGLEKVSSEKFGAVILDVMLPEMNGFEVLREIRRISTVPVLMLTALGDESDRIVGLELGADDYLPKTFSTRELLARLRSVIRRSEITSNQAAAEEDEEICLKTITVNPPMRKASLDGETLHLTPIEFDLLCSLMRSADRILSRDQLLDEIMGRNYEIFDRSIDVHISSLRRKLGDDPKNPTFIRTVRSAGYMFVDKFEE
ncbi:MAG: response regulator transcription factor [Pyrinomonadaceae bacterium]